MDAVEELKVDIQMSLEAWQRGEATFDETVADLLALARSNSWQPIETAPKDGRFILLATTVEGVRRPVVEGQWWTNHEMWSTDWEPTRWQPLPSPHTRHRGMIVSGR